MINKLKHPKSFTKTPKRYRPLDYLVLIYCLMNIAYILLGIILYGVHSNRMHDPLHQLLNFLIIILFVMLLEIIEKKYSSRLLGFVRDWYAIGLFVYFFEATSHFNRIIFPEFLDPTFQRFDKLIFGYQPAILWGTKFNSWLISEIFHFAYASYYVMGIFYIWVYYKNRALFLRYAFQLCFVFYTCYLTYNFLPVVGGRYFPEMMQLTETFRHGPFTRLMAVIYRWSEHRGGAFPSSHVAVAVLVLLSAFHYHRPLGWYLFPLVVLLSISTVYCHYHYFVDTIAGVFYGVVLYFLSAYIFDYKKKRLKNVQSEFS